MSKAFKLRLKLSSTQFQVYIEYNNGTKLRSQSASERMVAEEKRAHNTWKKWIRNGLGGLFQTVLNRIQNYNV